MRKFNPDKELNKINNGNKKKAILIVFALLIVGVLGYSFALYQVRLSNKLVYTVVKPFNDKDITLAVYLGDEPSNKFPEKNSGYKYDHINCDNNSTATFDNIKWELLLRAKDKDRCDVYFSTTYKDESGANAPELYQGLIPVIIADDGTVKVANTDTDWYNYGDKRWANAVLVDNSKTEIKNKYFNEDNTLKSNLEGTQIDMTEILQMYVWIPRYKYQLFNVNNDSINEQEIKVEFEKNTENSGDIECKYVNNNNGTITENCTEKGTEIAVTNNKWYTHPAFTFKGTLEESGTELTGIWVGKFETSGNNTNLKVIPNASSLASVNVSYMFNASRNMEEQYASNFNLKREEIDTHMMKNIEWGAMAYLTHSKYGRCTDGVCEEVSRNVTEYKTGYAGASETWNTTNGIKASTTGTIYGVYDTNGGAWEYVMGNMVNSNGTYFANNSGLATTPNEKYYDKYEYDATNYLSHGRGHLGDATRETLKTYGSGNSAWYEDYAYLPNATLSWLLRGGTERFAAQAGIFAFGPDTGGPYGSDSFRLVLSAA